MIKTLSFIFVIIFSYTSYAKNKISISNLPAEMQKELTLQFPKALNDEYSFYEIDQMMKWLHKKYNYDLIKVIRNSQGLVEFKIIPTTRLKSLTIKGNQTFSENEILSFFNVQVGDPYDSNLFIESGIKLKKFYQDNGFNNAEIELKFPSTQPNVIEGVIEIRENKRTLLKGIKIISDQAELNQKIEKKLKSKLDSVFSDSLQSEIQKIIRDYLTSNRYFRADIMGPEILYNSAGNEAYLTFKLDKTIRSSVIINGAKKYSVGRLEDVIDLDNFYSSNPNIANEMGTRIKNFYLSKGFARAEIQAQELPGKDISNTKIQIDIDEGPQVSISQIVFTGRLSKSSEEYAKLLKKGATDLIQDGYYNKTDFETSLNTLKVHLQNQGYLLAKPISTRTQYNKTKDQLSIFVNFDEGPLTELTDIHFIGQKSFSAEMLLTELDLKINEPLQLNKLQSAIQKLKTFYHETGYLEMTLLNENQEDDLVKYDETNTKAQVRFNIFEGPKVEVASILVEGNTFTKEKIILLELDFGVNDTLTPSRIEESISRLQRTGYFNTVEIKTLEERTNVSQRTVQVRVTERDPGLFTAGIGATSEREFTVRGFTGIAYNNLYGTGRGLSVRAEGNYNIGQIRFLETKGTVSYLEPYLFDTRVRFRGIAELTKALSDLSNRIGTDVNRYTMTLEKDFTSHVTGYFDVFNLSQSRDFNIDTNITMKRSDIASIGPSVNIDYLDNLANPTKGTYSRFSFEYSSPQFGSKTISSSASDSSSPIEYYLSTASLSHYYSFIPRWVWANSFKIGYLENLYKGTGPNSGVPYDKKGFSLGGGFSSIRGFDFESLPSKTDLGIKEGQLDKTYYLKTNATMGLIKTEIRFPISGDFGGNIFYDGGVVKITDLDIIDNYRDAIGVGLRYITPVGPVNIEVGRKLDRKENEDLYHLHFSIGSF